MQADRVETFSQDTPELTPEAGNTLESMVRRHVWAAMSMGLVPVPVVDFVGVAGIQLNMLANIAKHYEVPFARERVKSILAALSGGLSPATWSAGAASVVKVIPLVGQTLGSVTMPIIAGASTYATAQVFIRHFSSGGTLLDFDVEKVRAYYNAMYRKGQQLARTLKNEGTVGAEMPDNKL